VPNASDQFYQEMNYSVAFTAADKTYELRFSYEYRDDWNALTHGGSGQPPKQDVTFTGSKIQPWTSSNGLGVYSERYDRKIPNWLLFDPLDSILMMQVKMGNPLPSLTGMFYPDELKSLKKIHKESGTSDGGLQCGFDYDAHGNVAELSHAYLAGFSTKKTRAVKKIEDYSLTIRNKNDDVVFLEVLTTSSKSPIMEGIQFSSGDKRCVVFNFELNRILNKFAPELVSDPERLLMDYILALQEISAKPFARFETTASK